MKETRFNQYGSPIYGIGEAIEAVKEKQIAYREGGNGFLHLVTGAVDGDSITLINGKKVPIEEVTHIHDMKIGMFEVWDGSNGAINTRYPYIAITTPVGTMPYTPTQLDLLSDDWRVGDENAAKALMKAWGKLPVEGE